MVLRAAWSRHALRRVQEDCRSQCVLHEFTLRRCGRVRLDLTMSISLRELVEQYVAAAGGYGETVALSSLGLSREETERVFDVLDEDYHISRYFHFRNAAGDSFRINGFPQTHISIDAEIKSIL